MLTITAADPAKLLKDLTAAVKDGTLKTWSVGIDGDFSHTDSQMSGKGVWLRPITDIGKLRFRIYILKDYGSTTERRFRYVYMTGHMAMTMMTHFYSSVKSIEISPAPSGEDSMI